MNQRLLITGANGFIGSFLCEEALSRGYEVIAAIRSTSKTRWIADERIKKVCVTLDSREKLSDEFTEMKRRFGSVAYIVHNAGITVAPKLDDFMKINAQYTGHLIDAVRDSGILEGKLLFMSSIAAHGPGENDPKSVIRETDKSHPVSPYGKSKLAAEELIKSQDAIPWIILRPTAVYGPRDRDFLTFFRLIYRGKELYIGKGTQETSFIYILDAVKAILLALESDRQNRTYFVGESLYSAKDLYKNIKEALGVKRTVTAKIPIPLLMISSWFASRVLVLFNRYTVFNPNKIDELGRANWKMDTSRIRKELSFSPEYSLGRGIKETAEWYLKEGWLE
jgi:nucleoside-diphosphate-sugar epimerase